LTHFASHFLFPTISLLQSRTYTGFQKCGRPSLMGQTRTSKLWNPIFNRDSQDCQPPVLRNAGNPYCNSCRKILQAWNTSSLRQPCLIARNARSTECVSRTRSHTAAENTAATTVMAGNTERASQMPPAQEGFTIWQAPPGILPSMSILRGSRLSSEELSLSAARIRTQSRPRR